LDILWRYTYYIQALTRGGIAANLSFLGGRENRLGSAMVPLDRALLSSYMLPICFGRN